MNATSAERRYIKWLFFAPFSHFCLSRKCYRTNWKFVHTTTIAQKKKNLKASDTYDADCRSVTYLSKLDVYFSPKKIRFFPWFVGNSSCFPAQSDCILFRQKSDKWIEEYWFQVEFHALDFVVPLAKAFGTPESGSLIGSLLLHNFPLHSGKECVRKCSPIPRRSF